MRQMAGARKAKARRMPKSQPELGEAGKPRRVDMGTLPCKVCEAEKRGKTCKNAHHVTCPRSKRYEPFVPPAQRVFQRNAELNNRAPVLDEQVEVGPIDQYVARAQR